MSIFGIAITTSATFNGGKLIDKCVRIKASAKRFHLVTTSRQQWIRVDLQLQRILQQH